MLPAHSFSGVGFQNTDKRAVSEWVSTSSNTKISPTQQVIELMQCRITLLEEDNRRLRNSPLGSPNPGLRMQIQTLRNENDQITNALRMYRKNIDEMDKTVTKFKLWKDKFIPLARVALFEFNDDDGDVSEFLDDPTDTEDGVDNQSNTSPIKETNDVEEEEDDGFGIETREEVENAFYTHPLCGKTTIRMIDNGLFKEGEEKEEFSESVSTTDSSSSGSSSSSSSSSSGSDSSSEEDDTDFPENDKSAIVQYINDIKTRYVKNKYRPSKSMIKKIENPFSTNTALTSWTLSNKRDYTGINTWTKNERAIFKRKVKYYLKNRKSWPGWGVFSISFPEKNGTHCAKKFPYMFPRKKRFKKTRKTVLPKRKRVIDDGDDKLRAKKKRRLD